MVERMQPRKLHSCIYDLNETNSPVFVLLSVLCFQRQTFRFQFLCFSSLI